MEKLTDDIRFSEDMSEGIETPIIKENARLLFRLAKEIFESGRRYDLILSDDVSGRLVSLFIKKILDAVQSGAGVEKPDIRFVSSGRHNNKDTFESIGKLVAEISPQRTLVVTEYIETGASMKRLVDILNNLGLEFDVATLSQGSDLSLVYKSLKKDSLLFSSGYTAIGYDFHTDDGRRLGGVVKTSESQFPERIINDDLTEVAKKEIQEGINNVRKDIGVLAERTIERLGIIA